VRNFHENCTSSHYKTKKKGQKLSTEPKINFRVADHTLGTAERHIGGKAVSPERIGSETITFFLFINIVGYLI
jgi:hypothetical protein